MSIYYFAFDSKGNYLFDNFPEELKYLASASNDFKRPFKVTINKESKLARLGFKTNYYGTIYTLTTEDKYINRNKLFKELIDFSIISLRPLVELNTSIIDKQVSQTQELIHNLTSLNSYSIQNLYTLIPQKILSENFNNQSEIVKGILTEKPNVAVKTFLKLLKYNLAMKVEFSVFERTLKPNGGSQKMFFSIREIILSILQIFIDEFENRKIEVSLDACEKRLNVDHDSLYVSLFYLLDNSIKYCCPNTRFKIIFKKEPDGFSILFVMISIKIHKDEVSKLIMRGYRSDTAKQLNKEGHGIGMYRIIKTLKINDAELEITPKINDYTKKLCNVEYEGNQFKMKFLGQQDWFKINMR